MAPARSSTSRARRDQPQHAPQPQNISPPLDEENPNDDLFLDPLMGTPLAIYVEKDVENRDEIAALISVCRHCTDVFSVLRRVFRPPTPSIGIRQSYDCMCRPTVHGLLRLCTVLDAHRQMTDIFPSFLGLQKHGGVVSPGYSGVAYILGESLSDGMLWHIGHQTVKRPFRLYAHPRSYHSRPS